LSRLDTSFGWKLTWERDHSNLKTRNVKEKENPTATLGAGNGKPP